MIVRSILKPVARATSRNALLAYEENSSATASHNRHIRNSYEFELLVLLNAIESFKRSNLGAKPYITRKSKARYAIGS